MSDECSDPFTNRQTDRQTDRTTDPYTHRQTDRPTDRPTDRQTDRQAHPHTDRQTHSLEGDEDFVWLELERDLGGVCIAAGDPHSPPCNHQGLPLLVLQHLTLLQHLHSLLPNLSAAAVELVAVQNAQLHEFNSCC